MSENDLFCKFRPAYDVNFPFVIVELMLISWEAEINLVGSPMPDYPVWWDAVADDFSATIEEIIGKLNTDRMLKEGWIRGDVLVIKINRPKWSRPDYWSGEQDCIISGNLVEVRKGIKEWEFRKLITLIALEGDLDA